MIEKEQKKTYTTTELIINAYVKIHLNTSTLTKLCNSIEGMTETSYAYRHF